VLTVQITLLSEVRKLRDLISADALTIFCNAATLADITILPPANVFRNASFNSRMRAVELSIMSVLPKRKKSATHFITQRKSPPKRA